MKTIQTALLIGLAASAVIAAQTEDQQAIRKDMAQLQGEWSMVSGAADGQSMPEEMLKQCKRVCKGDETTTTMGGRLFMKARIRIDPSKTPKTIDYDMIDGFTKGKKQLGLYELDGDTFKACFGGPDAERPVDFTSKPGDRRTLSVWRRDKAATQGAPLEERPGTLRETVRGGIAFVPEKRQWVRISGKARVLNAHTLLFEDGTEVDLSGGMEAPELEQKGLIGDSFYACGREAAEFLRKLIGNQTVTCYANKEHANGNKMWIASGFVGETELGIEMVRNGWAVSDHSGMDAWEIIARENKRGLWRGQFVVPKKWRAGQRLPGE